MRMTERIITEDVDPSLVLSKLTSVASGLAGERDETKRRRGVTTKTGTLKRYVLDQFWIDQDQFWID